MTAPAKAPAKAGTNLTRTLHAFCSRCQVDPAWFVALCGWDGKLHDTFVVPPGDRVVCGVCIDLYDRPCERCGS